jgi:BlaI family transcriptional regulator, penicillinase repressor
MIRPNPSEIRILRALWRQSPLSARELHDATLIETGWSASATRKTLDRMEEKGLVTVTTAHGVKIYLAAHSKLGMLANLANAFARDVLEADAPLPVAAFAGSRLVSEEEVEELEHLLNTYTPLDEAGA